MGNRRAVQQRLVERRDAAALLKKDTAKWARVIKAKNIKPD